jgi:hypothetical protein
VLKSGRFRLQFYFNGHNLLASKLEKQGLEFEMLDNAFVQIEDWEGAQKLSDDWKGSPTKSMG